MKRLMTICAVAVMMVFGTSVAYALPLLSDNFNDNTMNTTLWTLVEDDHSKAWLDEETNHRLEMRSTASADDMLAYYAPNNWWLVPTSPTGGFSFKIDFHYSSMPNSSNNSNVFLGFGKSEDDYANITAGYDSTDGAYFSYQLEVGGSVIDSGVKARSLNNGRLYISYNATADELYLSDTGYASGNAWATFDNVVQGWGGAHGPFFGGWSDGMALASGDAYLDDFVVAYGTITPEPATVVLLGLGSLVLIYKRR